MAISTISSGVYAKVRIAYNPNQGATYIPRKMGDISTYSQTFLWDYYTTYAGLGFTSPQIFYEEYDLVTIKLGEDGLKIPLPLIDCKRYNYCMMMSETGFVYYYWITGYEVLNAKTTKIYLVLDSLQTYFPCLEKFNGTLARSMPYEVIKLPNSILMPNPDLASVEESPNDLTYIPTTYGWSTTTPEDYYLITINPPDTAVFQPYNVQTLIKTGVTTDKATVYNSFTLTDAYTQWLLSLYPDYLFDTTTQKSKIYNAYGSIAYMLANENYTYGVWSSMPSNPSFLVAYNGDVRDEGYANVTSGSTTPTIDLTREAILLMWSNTDNITHLYTTKGENYYNKYLYFLIPCARFKEFKSNFPLMGDYIISMSYIPGMFMTNMDSTKYQTLYIGKFYTSTDFYETNANNNYNMGYYRPCGYIIRDIDAFKIMSIPIRPINSNFYTINNEGSSYSGGKLTRDYENSVSEPHLAVQKDQTSLTCLTDISLESFFGAKFDLYPYRYVDIDYRLFTISVYTNNLYGYAYNGGLSSSTDLLESTNSSVYGYMSVYINFNQTPVSCNVAMLNGNTIMNTSDRFTTGWYLTDVAIPSFSVNYDAWSDYENYKRALDENTIKWQSKNFAVNTATQVMSMAISVGVNSYNFGLGSNLLNPAISGYDTRDYDYQKYSDIADLYNENISLLRGDLLTNNLLDKDTRSSNYVEMQINQNRASQYANMIYANQNKQGALPGLGFKNYGSVMEGSAISGMANSAVSGLGGIVSRSHELQQAREQLAINQAVLHTKAPTQKAYDSASSYMWKYPYTDSVYDSANYYPQSSFVFYEIKGTEKENLMQKYHIYGYATPFNLGVVNKNDTRYDEIFYSRMYRNFVQFETIDFTGWSDDIPLPTQDVMGDMLSRFVNGVNFVHLQELSQPFSVDMDVATLMRGNLEYPNQCLYVSSTEEYLSDGVMTSMAEYDSIGNYPKE